MDYILNLISQFSGIIAAIFSGIVAIVGGLIYKAKALKDDVKLAVQKAEEQLKGKPGVEKLQWALDFLVQDGYTNIKKLSKMINEIVPNKAEIQKVIDEAKAKGEQIKLEVSKKISSSKEKLIAKIQSQITELTKQLTDIQSSVEPAK